MMPISARLVTRGDISQAAWGSSPSLGNSLAKAGGSVPGAFLVLMLLYTIFALVQGAFSFVSINRIMGGAIVLVLAFDFVSRLTGKRVLAACVFCIIALIDIFVTSTNTSDDIDFFIYWTTTMLILCFMASPGGVASLQDAAILYGWLMRVTVAFSGLFILVLLLTKTGYVVSWGQSSYFRGLCNTQHTMASVCCIVIALSHFSHRFGLLKAQFAVPAMLVCSYALLQTGARTFLVPAATIWLLYIRDAVSYKWIRRLTYLALAAFVVYSFTSSGMADKFDWATSGSNSCSALSAFTSGRDAYWATDLGAWISGGPLGIVFGNSASSVYDLNERTFSMRIWAHDDFVMILCSVGVIGCTLYVIGLCAFFKGVMPFVRRYEFIFLLTMVLFPAFINGFYGYQHFVYATVFFTCAVAKTRRAECYARQ